MLDVLFWFFFLLTPLVIWFLLKFAGEKVNEISVMNITTVSIYVFSVLGLFPLFYQLDQYRVDTGVTNSKLVFVVLLCCFTAMLFFLLGAIFVRLAIGLRPYPIISSEIQPLKKLNRAALVLAFGVVVAVLALYLCKVGQPAIFVALKEGAAAAAVARSNMGNDFAKYHRYSLIMHDLGTLVTLSFFALWLLEKTFIRLVLFLAAFFVSSFVAVMATEKAPFVGLLMALFMVYYLVRKNGFVPKKDIVLLGVTVVVVLMVFYIYFMGSDSPISALMSVFSRAFAGSIAPAYFYLEYVPHIQDFYWFKTFPNPGHILPFEPVRYTVDIMNWKFPNLVEQGMVGSMPTVFWGEAYLNFGYLGVPIVAFIMGGFVAVVSYFISRLQVNAVSIAFTVWMIFHLKTLAFTGFSGFLYDFYIVGVGLMVLMILTATTKLKLRKF
ncbi:O-antigen polymerase [Oceanisphaera sp. KMM 10153]|uniref:O-antigen polymerase n=1 Tax=Oceanisphaera submarina TaxID=3390193 RepID=UPI0039763BE0